jgi:DNA-binding XRE family transcriptional regulator
MIIRTPAELGATIKDRRPNLQPGQRHLAERVGVSRQWLIEVERGKPGAEIGLRDHTVVQTLTDSCSAAEGTIRDGV